MDATWIYYPNRYMIPPKAERREEDNMNVIVLFPEQMS